MRLSDVLNEETLRQYAGEASYKRGAGYFKEQRVSDLQEDEDEDEISAEVQGTEWYEVRLWLEEEELFYSCDCPIGEDDGFCKHCVAVGLAWLGDQHPEDSKITKKELRSHLETFDKSELVDLLMGQISESKTLRQKLTMDLATKTEGGLNIRALRSMVDKTFRSNGFIEYSAMPAYHRRCSEVITQLARLLDEDHAPEVIELAELALEGCEETACMSDDSHGFMRGLLEDLKSLHYEACLAAPPDPGELAQRLFSWELKSGWDVFCGAAQTYHEIFGQLGADLYRRLTDEEWAKLPPLDWKEKRAYDRNRAKLTAMMESIARASGDLEELVAIKAKDLSTPYNYLQIATLYQQEQDHVKAVEWAEKGISAFPGERDHRLYEFLANELHRIDRHDEAMVLIWSVFSRSPDFQTYRNLYDHAETAGQWAVWRPKALTAVREDAGRKKKTGHPFWSPGHTELVRIFLWEKEVEAAWDAAREGGCATELALELARLREEEHPHDSLTIYRNCIEPSIDQKSNPGYETAVGYLHKVRELLDRIGLGEEFMPYLRSIKAAHKPKRNLMSLIAQQSWDEA